MAVAAHPDDESLGMGATLARYAAEGVEVSLVTATRGEAGRFRGHPPGHEEHPGPEALGAIRERELRAAADVLGVDALFLLGYADGHLDRADPREAAGRIADAIRRARPHVVLTFGPDGAYGHPDHIAISQFTAAAVVRAAEPAPLDGGDEPHAVSKLYFMAWPAAAWAAYQSALKRLVSVVDGVERQAVPWPDWAVTTVVDTRDAWQTAWRAVSCHESQVTAYEQLARLSDEHHQALWGRQCFYRVFSLTNGGRARETDLFEGIRALGATAHAQG
jgi:LmbE family N-acetylglucosaminyl deacetylase